MSIRNPAVSRCANNLRSASAGLEITAYHSPTALTRMLQGSVSSYEQSRDLSRSALARNCGPTSIHGLSDTASLL